MVVLRTEIVFSMKLTPDQLFLRVSTHDQRQRRDERTQRLNVVLVEASFNVLDHQTRLSYL